MFDLSKTFSQEQLENLSMLACENQVDEESLLKEALDDLLLKYNTRKRKSKTVMLVDDSTFMRATLRGMIQKHGFKVLGEAENGKLGAQYYNNFWVDYILVGIQMPVMDGMEFLKNISKRKNCRVIVVSAACKAKTILEAIALGADYFVIKPFTSEQMIDVLSMHEDEYFSSENIEKYSNFFYNTQQYSEDTTLTQIEIDELRECL